MTFPVVLGAGQAPVRRRHAGRGAEHGRPQRHPIGRGHRHLRARRRRSSIGCGRDRSRPASASRRARRRWRRAAGDASQLFAHPFSSYMRKVLIALWADDTPFTIAMLDDEHPGQYGRARARTGRSGNSRCWSTMARPVVETTSHHRASRRRIIPAPTAGSPTATTAAASRFLDRFFDLYVMDNMRSRRCSTRFAPTEPARRLSARPGRASRLAHRL